MINICFNFILLVNYVRHSVEWWVCEVVHSFIQAQRAGASIGLPNGVMYIL